MSSLNHTNVVRTITDGEEDCLLVFLDELDYESLLQGRHSACARMKRYEM